MRDKIFKFFNVFNNFNKWWTCFVEWENDDGTTSLSVIPWHVLFLGILGNTNDFKWKWVPPWKIKVGN